MKKDRNFMSSKQIYFLPIINKVNSGKLRKSFDVQHSPSKLKSIEQIMHDKSLSEKPKDNVTLQLLKRPKAHHSQNLYNKYELLPKIMSKKLKRKHKSRPQIQTQTITDHSNREKNTEQTSSEKENPINFSSSFYQKQFKTLLARQVNNIPFQLAASYSNHNLLMSKNIDEDPVLNKRNVAKKYTKMHITEPQDIGEDSLEKVPEFLLRLLEPCRK